MNSSKSNIIIIGNGLSGFQTIKQLLKLKANESYNLVVVDSRTFYEQDIMSTAFLTWAGQEAYDNAHSFPDWKLKQPGVHEYITDTVVSVEENEQLKTLTVKLKNYKKDLTAVAVVCATGFTVPVLKPSTGATWDARKDELKKYRDAMKNAKSVLIGGGGSSALCMAGDARLFCDVENGAKIHIVMSKDTVLNDTYGNDDRSRITKFVENSEGVVLHKNDRMAHDGYDLPSCEKNCTYTLKSGKKIVADVYIPCFAKWVAKSYLQNIDGATKENGLVVVNHDSLQSKVNPRIFAVGCSDLIEEEGWNGIPKILPSSKTVAINVLKYLNNDKSLVKHKTDMKAVKHEFYTHFGHGHFFHFNTDKCGMPGICCRYLCGFPFPCLCCFCCAVPSPCGFSCVKPTGKECIKMARSMATGKQKMMMAREIEKLKNISPIEMTR
jgi:NADH dehydrogenase FAD-containing subunit